MPWDRPRCLEVCAQHIQEAGVHLCAQAFLTSQKLQIFDGDVLDWCRGQALCLNAPERFLQLEAALGVDRVEPAVNELALLPVVPKTTEVGRRAVECGGA